MKEIIAGHPDVILYNNRSIFLEPFLGEELDTRFKQILSGVWVLQKFNLPVDTSAGMPLKFYFSFEPSF